MRLEIPARGDGRLPAASTDLSVVMDRQWAARWCWAAVTAAVARHCGLSVWPQERIAASRSGFDGPAPADGTARLEDAFTLVGCLGHWTLGRPHVEQLAAALAQDRPVAVRICRPAGGAHFVLLSGHTGDGRPRVLDPAIGALPHLADPAERPTRHPALARLWHGTYWTRPPSDTEDAGW